MNRKLELENCLSRRDAINTGEKFYFTGISCKFGHIAKRRVTTCCCVICERIKSCNSARKFKEDRQKRALDYYYKDIQKSRERGREKAKEFRKRNPNSIRLIQIRTRAKHRDKILEKQRAFKKFNKNKVNAINAKRRAAKRNAIPKWADLEEIKQIYINCPEGYQVDHIVPLLNPIVCGLHVPWNLQYLTPEQNNKKGNKLYYLYTGNSDGDSRFQGIEEKRERKLPK